MPSRILFPIKRRDVALMALLFFGLIPGSTWTQETPAAKEFEQNLEPLADAELLGDWRAYQQSISEGKGSSAFFTERGPKRAEAWKRLAEGNSAMGMVLVGRCGVSVLYWNLDMNGERGTRNTDTNWALRPIHVFSGSPASPNKARLTLVLDVF